MKPPSVRVVFLVLALGLSLAAIFPELGLVPVRELVLGMRAPDNAPSMARWIFGASAAVFAIVFLAWRWCRIALASLIAGIIELPSATFWLLVLVAGLLPRLLVALVVFYQPKADAAWFHAAAAAMARGEGLAVDGQLTAYRPPGYPFLLSLTYRLFGPDFRLAWFWGVLSTAIIVVAIHFIASRLYGHAVARVATLGAATYPALVLMTGQAMSDLPFVAGLLALVGFALVDTPHRLRDAIVIGIAVGLLTLTRSVAIGLFAVVALIWHLRQPDLRRLTTSLMVMAITCAACLAPWVLRNQAAFGNPTLGTNFGMNAYVGNHRGARGGAVPAAWPQPADGTPRNEAQEDRELLRVAIDFVVSNPGEAAALLPGKLKHLYLLEAEAVTALFQGEHPSPDWVRYSLYAGSQVAYALLLIAFGLRATDLFSPGRRPRGAQWSGWVLIGYFTTLALVFHGQDRYRLPILPWMLIEGAVVLARAARSRIARTQGGPALPEERGTAEFARNASATVR